MARFGRNAIERQVATYKFSQSLYWATVRFFLAVSISFSVMMAECSIIFNTFPLVVCTFKIAPQPDCARDSTLRSLVRLLREDPPSKHVSVKNFCSVLSLAGGGGSGEGVFEVELLGEVLPILLYFVVEAAEISCLTTPATLVLALELGQVQQVVIV